MGQKKQRCGKRGNRKMKVRSAGMPARKMNPPLLAGPKVVKQALPFQFFGLTEAASNTGIDRVYRLNDIYDPDYTELAQLLSEQQPGRIFLPGFWLQKWR